MDAAFDPVGWRSGPDGINKRPKDGVRATLSCKYIVTALYGLSCTPFDFFPKDHPCMPWIL